MLEDGTLFEDHLQSSTVAKPGSLLHHTWSLSLDVLDLWMSRKTGRYQSVEL